MEHEAGVPHEEVGVELEGELRRILGRVERPGRLSLPDQSLEASPPALLNRRDPVLHRPGTRAELDLDGGEEAAAREDAALEVGEEAVEECPELLERVGDRLGRLDDL